MKPYLLAANALFFALNMYFAFVGTALSPVNLAVGVGNLVCFFFLLQE